MRAGGFTPVEMPNARIKSGHERDMACQDAVEGAEDILHLIELVPIVRSRLKIKSAFSDDAIFASLKKIVQCATQSGRRRAAFKSQLGLHLCHKGQDLSAAIVKLLALLPKAHN